MFHTDRAARRRDATALVRATSRVRPVVEAMEARRLLSIDFARDNVSDVDTAYDSSGNFYVA
jgi:hypothetical protein